MTISIFDSNKHSESNLNARSKQQCVKLWNLNSMWDAKILVFTELFTAQFYCHYVSLFTPHTTVTVVCDMFLDEKF